MDASGHTPPAPDAPEPEPDEPRAARSHRRPLLVLAVAVLAVVGILLAVLLPSSPHHHPAATPTPLPPPPTTTSPTPTPPPTPSPTATRETYLGIGAGDCFDAPLFDSHLHAPKKVSCSSPHDEQATGLAKLPSSLKNLAMIQMESSVVCEPVTQKISKDIPKDSYADLQLAAEGPSLSDYRKGIRTAICGVTSASAAQGHKLTASLFSVGP